MKVILKEVVCLNGRENICFGIITEYDFIAVQKLFQM